MMLLPSGRSNSDVYPLQNAANTTTATSTGGGGGGVATGGPGGGGPSTKPKPLLLTRTSSPQLTTSQPTTNGSVVHATPIRSNGCPQPQSTSSSASSGIPSTLPTTIATPSAATGVESTTTELGIGNGTNCGSGSGTGIYGPLLGQSHGSVIGGVAENWPEIDGHLEAIQEKLKPGWSVHVGKEGRLYYCK